MNYPPSSALRTPRSSGGGFTPGNSQIGFRAPKTRQERQTNFKVLLVCVKTNFKKLTNSDIICICRL